MEKAICKERAYLVLYGRNLSQNESHCKYIRRTRAAAQKTAAIGGKTVKKFSISIPINPVPKARPRFTRAGHVYTPKKTADYEKAIAEYWEQATKGFSYDREQPLVVNLGFGLPIPKSTPKYKRHMMQNGTIKPTKKVDVDNLAKAVMDALNGVAWGDDSQVVKTTIFKEYTEHPYVYIYIHDDAE